MWRYGKGLDGKGTELLLPGYVAVVPAFSVPWQRLLQASCRIMPCLGAGWQAHSGCKTTTSMKLAVHATR